ncbi:hypothetical protein DSO57_1035663 [Entomophthora muscae]|uniref:Uncharacterized protein n=1 Tax=Entomophthora muscae TaxID=34485 RepID=A0ACC2RE69_9FUNG|nr:hypothetical protein DSO57_1035663 [Entomophthora muscae]
MKYPPFDIVIRLIHVVRYVKGRLIERPLCESGNSVATKYGAHAPDNLPTDLPAEKASPQPRGVKTAGLTPSKVCTRDPVLLKLTSPTLEARCRSQLELPKQGTRTNDDLIPAATQLCASLLTGIKPPPAQFY